MVWKLIKLGGFPIALCKDFSSCAFISNNNVFKSSLTRFKYNGDCSLVVERGTVDPEMGVRFSSFALRAQEENNSNLIGGSNDKRKF